MRRFCLYFSFLLVALVVAPNANAQGGLTLNQTYPDVTYAATAQAASCEGAVIKRLIAGGPWGGAWETDTEEFAKMVFICSAAGSVSGTSSRDNTQQNVSVTITGNKVSWKVRKTSASFTLKEEGGNLVLSGKITGTTEDSDERDFEKDAVLFSRSQTVARLVKNSPWKGTWVGTRRSKAFQVTFKITGGKLTGTAWKNHGPMYDIVVVGNRVTFHIFSTDKRKIDFEGLLKGVTLSGTASGPGRRNPDRRFSVNWKVSHKRLFVNSFDYLPVFTIGNSSDKKRYVLLFLSPTCNYCNELYLNILSAIRNGTYDVGDKELTFVLFPRNSADYVIARSLLCAGSVKFPKVFNDYQKSIYKQFRGEVINGGFAQRAARRVAKGHGVTDEALSQCDKNEKFNQAIASMFAFGTELDKSGVVPIVIVDGKATDIKSFSDLAAY